jgi:hypothetical protein
MWCSSTEEHTGILTPVTTVIMRMCRLVARSPTTGVSIQLSLGEGTLVLRTLCVKICSETKCRWLLWYWCSNVLDEFNHSRRFENAYRMLSVVVIILNNKFLSQSCCATIVYSRNYTIDVMRTVKPTRRALRVHKLRTIEAKRTI